MEKTFEQRMDDATSNSLGLPSAMIDYYDAIKIAREADAIIADLENKAISAEAAQQGMETELINLRNGYYQDEEIARLTALNIAKGELIDFYTNYLSSISGYLATHQMSPSELQVEYGNRLRARIRSLESE